MEINEKLRAAADRAYAVMSTPDVCDTCPERSPEYTRRLEKLVSKADSSRLWKLYNTGAKRAAALFITALLLISASLSVKAIREPVSELFANVFDTHTKFETSVYFGSVMSSDGGSIEFDSLSLVPEVITFIEAEHEGEQIDFTMNGITHTYEYLFTWNVDTLPGPVLDYTYREEGKPSVGLSIMSDYPEFINWTDEEFDGLEGDFDDESLEFALATISERYGEDVSGYQMFFDYDNAKSVVVSKDVDGLKIKIGRCAVRETEDGYKIQSLLVFPKRLQDKFHLKYTIDEIKEIVESELAAKYPGSKVNSVLIGNSKYNNTYMYLVAKETWAYAFFINATIVREDGDEITTDIGCYIPFDIDE